MGLAHQSRLLRRARCWNVYREKDCDGPCPQRQLALMDVRPGDVLVVVNLLALAATLLELREILLRLRKDDVGLWILEQKVDVRTAELGALAVSTLLEAIERTRAERRELTRRGLAAARENGRIGGRPRVPNAKLTAARELMAAKRYSMAEIAERVGIARASLYNAGLKAGQRGRADKEKPPTGGG